MSVGYAELYIRKDNIFFFYLDSGSFSVLLFKDKDSEFIGFNDKCIPDVCVINRLLCIMKRQRRNDILIRMIADRLIHLRNEKGLSQQIVYIDTELHMGRIERGEYNITLSTLAELCAYYNVSLKEFFKGIPNP